MHCRLIFFLPSAGSVPLIVTLAFFAVPHVPDQFTFFLSSFCPTFPINWLQRLSSEGCFAFSCNCLGLYPYPFCPSTLLMCIILMCSLHPACFYKSVQDYTTAFPALLSGDCRHKVWLDPAKLVNNCCKRTDTGHLSGTPDCLWKCLVLPWLSTNVISAERKKMHVWLYRKQRGLKYIWKH